VKIFEEALALRHLSFSSTRASQVSPSNVPTAQPKHFGSPETDKIYLESLETTEEYIPNFLAYISCDGCPLSLSRLCHLRFDGDIVDHPENAWSLMRLTAQSLETFSCIDSFGKCSESSSTIVADELAAPTLVPQQDTIDPLPRRLQPFPPLA
jgi:hypothetical protein